MNKYISLSLFFFLACNSTVSPESYGKRENPLFAEFIKLFPELEERKIFTQEIVGGYQVGISDEDILSQFVCEYQNTCVLSVSPKGNLYNAIFKLKLDSGIYLLAYNTIEAYVHRYMTLATFDSTGKKIDKLLIHDGNQEFWLDSSLNISDSGEVEINLETMYHVDKIHCDPKNNGLADNIECFLSKKQRYGIDGNGRFAEISPFELNPKKMRNINNDYKEVTE